MKANLRSLEDLPGTGKSKLTEDFLKLPVNQLIGLLVREIEAKNEAYNFIFKKGLMSDFLNFKEETD